MANQKNKIIDLREICNKPKTTIYEGLLWRYEDTPLTQVRTGNFDANTCEISYTIQEYTTQGELINKDCKNINKIQLKHDKKKQCGIHFVLGLMGLKEVAVFEVNPALRKTVAHVLAEENNADIPIFQIVEKKYQHLIGTNVIWVIEIVEAIEVIIHADLTIEKRLFYLDKYKQEAARLFKEKKYKEAIEIYNKIRPFMDQIPKIQREVMTEEQKNQFKTELSRCYSNQAICYFLMDEWSKTIELADKAIQAWTENFKAYYFKARAYLQRGQESEAEPILLEILLKFPNEDLTEVKQYLQKYKKQKKQLTEQQLWQKIFEQLPEKDKYEEQQQQQEKFEKLQQNKKIEKLLEKANKGYEINQDDIQKI